MKHHRRVPTTNKMGWSSNTLNELSELFVEACAKPFITAIDIGAALGIATLPALAGGAHLLANDSSQQHLLELKNRTPEADKAHLTLMPGRFHRDIKLPAESLDLAHASNVFHFFTGRQIEQSAALLQHALRPGGRAYIIAATPYMSTFEAFIPTYEARVQAKAPWPGWIENTRDFSTHRLLSNLPKSIHLLDASVLTRVFEAAGFETERCWQFRRRDLPKSIHLDERESVAWIGRKT